MVHKAIIKIKTQMCTSPYRKGILRTLCKLLFKVNKQYKTRTTRLLETFTPSWPNWLQLWVGYNMRKGSSLPNHKQIHKDNISVDTSMVSDTHLEHLKLITTLRSCKEIDKTVYPNLAHIDAHKSSGVSSEELEPLSSVSKSVSEKKGKEKVFCQIPTPFPQRFWVPKKGTKNAEIYKLFKQVKNNIPILDVIKQIPAYAKFLKDLCIVKCIM